MEINQIKIVFFLITVLFILNPKKIIEGIA